MKFDREIISVTEAAKLCKVTRATIWRWVKSGLLNAGVTAGGHYRISREDLHKLIQSKDMMSCSRTEINKHKILIVDDDPSVREFLVMTFMKNGFQVDSASDGFEVGIKIMKFQPHIVILDLYMPKMDGFEVCRQLKKNSDTAKIIIIAISGYNDPENKDKILDYGADCFFPKPMDMKVVISEINNLIRSEEM
ncbi:MAG: response regulator [Desulfobacula sp.]|jgi:excisionase family DNA binding protein|nr:response regulator [Desulfobacula sp.]